MNPTDRQSLLYIHDEITAEEFANAPTANVIEYAVPPGCKQEGVPSVTVVEAFDAATTDVIDTGTSTDPNGYNAATDLKTAGTTAGAGAELGNYVPAGDNVVVTRTPTGAATNVGKVRVTIGYLVDNRGTETQG